MTERPRQRQSPDGPDGAAAPVEETLRRIATRIRADLATRAGERGGERASVPPAGRARDAAASDAEPADPRLQAHLARLAHELRTPLGAIAAMADAMRGEHFGPLADPRYKDYAGSIHDSARHLLAVAESMLDRQRLEAAPPLTFVDLDLAALIDAIVMSYRPLAEAAGLRLEHEIADRLPRVVADSRCVRQILQNLIGNSLKFTPRGGRIRVRARPSADGGLSIEVQDDGPGMAAKAAGTGQAGGGLGFGLPISHALAAATGAALDIGSQPGQGTRALLQFGAGRLVPV